MKNTNQEGLKYQKLYNWAHTLITSGVIRNMDKFPSEPSLQKKVRIFQADSKNGFAAAGRRRADHPGEREWNICVL